MDEAAVLTELVKAYSPSGREQPGVRAFMAVAKDLGVHAEVDEAGNGIARIGSGKPQIVFLGHIDTAGGEIPVRTEDGRLVGRGARDAKGALAAALLAARNHAGQGEILVVAAVGGKSDARGVRYLVPKLHPDYLFVGQPTGWAGVAVGSRGSIGLTLTFEGERVAPSSPTATTVETALAFLESLRSFCTSRPAEAEFQALTARVQSINSARMGGREVVKVGMTVYLPPGVKSREVTGFLDESGLAGKYKVGDVVEAAEVDTRNDVVRALQAGIRELGGRAILLRSPRASDLDLVLPAWDCPAAAYGPGDPDEAGDEGLDLEELRKAVRVLEDAFLFLSVVELV